MILVVGGTPPVRLDEPGELRRMHAVVERSADLASLVAGVEGLDVAAEGLAVTPALLRALAGPLGGEPEWQEGLDGAVRYARERGWWDDEREAVLVHVER